MRRKVTKPKGREFYGDFFALPLVNYLNEKSPDYGKLVSLIHSAEKLRSALRPITPREIRRLNALTHTQLPSVAQIREMPELRLIDLPVRDIPKSGQEKVVLHETYRINSILREIPFSPSLWGVYRGRWQMEWSLGSEIGGMVFSVIRLAVDGALWRLRECERPDCRKWFAARKTIQRHCTTACRQAVYEKTEARKKQKREAAHKLYHGDD